jgi:hypothetical protein
MGFIGHAAGVAELIPHCFARHTNLLLYVASVWRESYHETAR